MNILIFNCGSSSLSYKLFHAAAGELTVLMWGKAHRVGVRGVEPAFLEFHRDDAGYECKAPLATHREAATRVFDYLTRHQLPVDAVGHRFVHGGTHFTASTQLDETRLAALRECLPLAPLHNPIAYSVIEATRETLPETPQYVAFDTAFHAPLPEPVYTYALPANLCAAQGFRKYGFHGLSYQDVSQKAAEYLHNPALRLVACHLGTGGSSVAAIQGGRSVETSMGYSPLPGLVMSTRSGDLDPAILLDLVKHGYGYTELTQLLNTQSGLLGISGLSSDMRDLIRAQETGHAGARLAFQVYTHRLKLYIGAMIAALGGLDALAFTDDVGLRCPEIRAAACAGMDFCGIQLDAGRNKRAEGTALARISPDDAPVAVMVIPNDEERMIAAEGVRIFGVH